MSVLKLNRDVSNMQFVETARELEIFTIKASLKFPKRATFFITTEIVKLAQEVYNGVKSANSIFVQTPHDLQMRLDYLTKANCALQCLISQLGMARELFGSQVKSPTWERWFDYIEKEAKLISATKKSDREKHKFDTSK